MEVTISGNEHDEDIDSELATLTHSATGYTAKRFMVRSLDDDFEITASPSSINEDDAATDVVVTVTAGLGADVSAGTVSVTVGADTDTGAADADFEDDSPPAAAAVPVTAAKRLRGPGRTPFRWMRPTTPCGTRTTRRSP